MFLWIGLTSRRFSSSRSFACRHSISSIICRSMARLASSTLFCTSASISSFRFSSSSSTLFCTSSSIRFAASSSTIFCSTSRCRLEAHTYRVFRSISNSSNLIYKIYESNNILKIYFLKIELNFEHCTGNSCSGLPQKINFISFSWFISTYSINSI